MLYHYAARFLLFVLVSLFWAGNAWGQAAPTKPLDVVITKPLDVVNLDLGGRSFLGTNGAGIPFDVPFLLTGKAEGIERMELQYRIRPDETRRAYFYVLAKEDVSDKVEVNQAPKGTTVEVRYDEVDTVTYLIVTRKRNFFRVARQTPFPKFNISVTALIPNFIDSTQTLPKDAVVTAAIVGERLKVSHSAKSSELKPRKLDITSWHYFPTAANIGVEGYTRDPIIWERIASTDNAFSMTVPPLHPNVGYEFRFKVYLKPDVPDTELIKLKKELLSAMGAIMRVEKTNANTTDTFKKVDVELDKIVRAKLTKRGELVNADGTTLTFSISNPPFLPLADSLLKHSTQSYQKSELIKTSFKSLTGERPSLINGNGYKVYIQDEINAIRTGKLILTTEGQMLYEQTLAEAPGVTIREVSEIIAKVDQFRAIVNGGAQITTAGLYQEYPARSRPANNSPTISYLLKTMRHLLQAPITAGAGASTQLFKSAGVKDMLLELERLYSSFGAGASAEQYARNRIIATDSLPGLIYNVPPSLNQQLKSMLADPDLLTSTAKALLDKPVNPGLPDFKTVTGLQTGVFVHDMFNNPAYLEEILAGRAKISPNGLSLERKADKEVDLQSVKLILTFLRLVNSPVFLTRASSAPLFSGNDASDLNKLNSALDSFVARLEVLNDNLAQSLPRGSQLADLLVDKLIAQSYLVSGASTVNMNVQVDKNPYIGLDFGIGVAPLINTVFIHEGFNIYLRPVNKDTPLSTLRGSDRLLKSISLFVGFTQTISSNTLNTEYANLFDEGVFKSSFLFGTGYRFNRLMRLNVSGMVYRRVNKNPLVAGRTIGVTPAISLAFELNLGKALSSAGKLFK